MLWCNWHLYTLCNLHTCHWHLSSAAELKFLFHRIISVSDRQRYLMLFTMTAYLNLVNCFCSLTKFEEFSSTMFVGLSIYSLVFIYLIYAVSQELLSWLLITSITDNIRHQPEVPYTSIDVYMNAQLLCSWDTKKWNIQTKTYLLVLCLMKLYYMYLRNNWLSQMKLQSYKVTWYVWCCSAAFYGGMSICRFNCSMSTDTDLYMSFSMKSISKLFGDYLGSARRTLLQYSWQCNIQFLFLYKISISRRDVHYSLISLFFSNCSEYYENCDLIAWHANQI